ncbi:hypothetical protein [Ciceribacter ferrooxidans]|uniref:hypothetical protein n=1 Tax=Ciceribacter ferrooxidans TaxID=2509717 RepID=UPI0013EDFA96|nr:hypothetical protein [Ciceribacter ferrooxidans]
MNCRSARHRLRLAIFAAAPKTGSGVVGHDRRGGGSGFDLVQMIDGSHLELRHYRRLVASAGRAFPPDAAGHDVRRLCGDLGPLNGLRPAHRHHASGDVVRLALERVIHRSDLKLRHDRHLALIVLLAAFGADAPNHRNGRQRGEKSTGRFLLVRRRLDLALRRCRDGKGGRLGGLGDAHGHGSTPAANLMPRVITGADRPMSPRPTIRNRSR